MQHFILNGKILELEKNKETALPIPVLFNAGTAEFTLEIPEGQFKQGTNIELSINSSFEGPVSKKLLIEMLSNIRRFHLPDIANIEAKDYLLYSCKSNHAVRLSLVIAVDH